MNRRASRTTMPSLIASLALILALGAAHIGAAEPAGSVQRVGAGQALPELRLKDQHDGSGSIDAQARLVLFAPDRESSEIAHAVLEALGGEAMERSGIRYIADISAMPGLVTRMFALPKMRDYDYPLLLGREAADTAMLPRRPGELTLMALEAGRVTGVDYVGSSDALRNALEAFLQP